MNITKKLFLLFLSPITLFATSSVTPITSNLIKKDFEMKLTYSSSFQEYVALKELKAYAVALRVKPLKFYGLYLNYEHNNITYKGFDLTNDKYEIINKINVYNSNKLNVTFDFTYIKNRARDISITHNATLNKILSSTDSDSEIKIVDDQITYSGGTIKVYDKDGNSIQPEVRIDHMYSDSFNIKSYIGYKINRYNLIDLYFGATKNSIKANIQSYPEISFIKNSTTSLDIESDEYVALLGFTYIYNYSPFQVEINYEYNQFFRPYETEYNENQLLNVAVSLAIYKNVSLFMEGKYMTHQFMSDIPYSYNKLTSYTFDRHYGYVKTGLVFSF